MAGDRAFGLELRQRLAHGVARQRETRGEFALGGQLAAGADGALRHGVEQEGADFLRAVALAAAAGEVDVETADGGHGGWRLQRIVHDQTNSVNWF